MIFTFICFLTSMFFWLAFVLFWKILFSGRKPVLSAAPLLHEKAIHSFSSMIGLLIVPVLVLGSLLLGFLKETELMDARMLLLCVTAIFISAHYLIRAARSLF